MTEEPNPVGSRSNTVWTLLFVVSLGLLVAVTSFGAGMLSERDVFSRGPLGNGGREAGRLDSDAEPAPDVAFPRLAEVRNLIEEEYYYRPASPEAVPAFDTALDRDAVFGMATAAAVAAASPVADLADYRRTLEYGAIRGMTDGLPDDYSTFLEPVQQAPVAEEMAGQYEGIGVWVEQQAAGLTIVSIFPGSPAEDAGLKPGDIVAAADGHDLSRLPKEDALKLVRGPAHTTVRLTVRRPGSPAPFDVDVERRAITTPVVSYRTVADGRIAWIAIAIFNNQTTQQLDAALKRAKSENVTGIVLDLRSNGGGWVDSAREVIGRFVPTSRGPALYEDDDASVANDLQAEPIVGGGENVFNLPLAVLVDGGTASAAEIVAGALHDYERAKLVGTPTFGKGLVQRVHTFPDGSSARITSAQWLTPDKQPIPKDGLKPDVLVKMPENGKMDNDPQLDRAIAVALGKG